jgi:hypothetical protein
VKGILGPVLASALTLAGCYTGPSADHFVAIVDELEAPAGWQVAQTVVRGPDQSEFCNPGVSTECPAAIRTYLVEGDIDAAFAQAKEAITGAGFAVTDEATSGCSSGSSNGPPCGFFAHRGDDQLYVGVYASPGEAGLGEGIPRDVAVVVHASSST